MSLPNMLMATFEILEFVKAAICYPNVSIAYGNSLNDACDCGICRKKFLEVKIIKKLLDFVNVTRNVEWSSHFRY